jgi:hypothetical protein
MLKQMIVLARVIQQLEYDPDKTNNMSSFLKNRNQQGGNLISE